MKPIIYCSAAQKGNHTFYLVSDNQEYYLFSQSYRSSVHHYYSRGVSLNEALDFSKAHNNNALIRTMQKLPVYIAYVEKYYDILVLDKTKKRASKTYDLNRECA